MLEGKFKEKVLKDLRSVEQLYVLKTQEMARRGVPDLLICYKGKFIAIELKVDGAKPTKLQDIKLNEIRLAGGLSFSTTPSQWDSHLEMMLSA